MIVLAEGVQQGGPTCPLALWAVACVVSEDRGLGLFPERREAPWRAQGLALLRRQPQTLPGARGGRGHSVALQLRSSALLGRELALSGCPIVW